MRRAVLMSAEQSKHTLCVALLREVCSADCSSSVEQQHTVCWLVLMSAEQSKHTLCVALLREACSAAAAAASRSSTLYAGLC